MSAFVISRDPSDGRLIWWESWHALGLPKERETTPEEEAIMERVVFENDTAADRARLRELLLTEDIAA